MKAVVGVHLREEVEYLPRVVAEQGEGEQATHDFLCFSADQDWRHVRHDVVAELEAMARHRGGNGRNEIRVTGAGRGKRVGRRYGKSAGQKSACRESRFR